MSSSESPRRLRLIALTLGLLLGLLAAEVALRLLAPRPAEIDVLAELARELEAPARAGDCSPPAPQARLREIVAPSPHSDVVYELEPSVDTCFEGAPVSINSAGVRRSVEVASPKPAGMYRILTVGDSHAFGWGIAEESTVAAQLEVSLSGSEGSQVEVINAGVPGYNAYQQAAWLEAHGDRFEPDCVLVLFVANDMGLPHFLLRPTPSGPSRLWDLARSATASNRWFRFAPNELATFVSEVDMERIPERYRHMVGEAGYREALAKMARWAETRGSALVNLFDYQTLDVDREALVAYQSGLGFVPLEMPWPLDRSLRVADDDPHLNREGNARVVEFLAEALEHEAVCAPATARMGR